MDINVLTRDPNIKVHLYLEAKSNYFENCKIENITYSLYKNLIDL